MSKKKEVVKPIASSQKSEDNYNLESRREKLKEQGVSRLILKMYEDKE